MTVSLETSTRVLFPRFEYEDDPARAINERKLLRRAPPKGWLIGVEIAPLLEPKTLVHHERLSNPHRNWWGVSHSENRSLAQGETFYSPFSASTELFRSWLIRHDYLWDHQACDGQAVEIVLERLQAPAANFQEMAALLIRDTHYGLSDHQEFVVAGEAGEWREPIYGEPDDWRDFCLTVLLELATGR